ncbi:MAG: carbohydrate ABC transporter permease [Actinomycetes bacterium]
MSLLRTVEIKESAPVARKRRGFLPFSGWHLLLMPTALLFALPLVQMILTSFMTDAEINSFPPHFIPTSINLSGYQGFLTESLAPRWLLNTVIVATISVTSHLILCSVAGYGYARLKFRGRNFGFFAIVATIMIPTQLLMIPTYVMFSKIGVVDTLAAAFIPWLTSAFGIFLMRQFFLSLPKELEEAGHIDGLSTFGVFRRIVLPLAKPALATLAVFTLLNSWNDLIWPLTAISNQDNFTIQVGLTTFQGMRRTQWSVLMAGNVVATLPLIVGFLMAQKQFVATMTFSGLKG